MRARIQMALLAVVAGCAGHTGRPDYPIEPVGAEADDDAFADDTSGASGRPPDRAGATAAPAAPTCPPLPAAERSDHGDIGRDELDAVLDAGPPAFLRGVRVDAALDGGHFLGWRVRSFFPCDARFAHVDLVPGDVVVLINGVRLERPEQFSKLWEGLREAPALTIELERGGEHHTLAYTIVD